MTFWRRHHLIFLCIVCYFIYFCKWLIVYRNLCKVIYATPHTNNITNDWNQQYRILKRKKQFIRVIPDKFEEKSQISWNLHELRKSHKTKYIRGRLCKAQHHCVSVRVKPTFVIWNIQCNIDNFRLIFLPSFPIIIVAYWIRTESICTFSIFSLLVLFACCLPSWQLHVQS